MKAPRKKKPKKRKGRPLEKVSLDRLVEDVEQEIRTKFGTDSDKPKDK
jgi:hypothetical protein